MAQMHSMTRDAGKDDLNELMPMHFKGLANLEHVDKDGDTLYLHEYLGSKSHINGFGTQMAEPLHQRTTSQTSVQMRHGGGQHEAATEMHNGTDNSRWIKLAKAVSGQMAGEPAEQENTPPRMDALALYLSKPRPKGRGLRREGSRRVARKRTFGLDLKQLAQQRDDSDSEIEWEARNQELARQRAERSAQRQLERASRQRRQSLAGKRQSMGPQAMELDSDDDVMEDLDFGGGGEMGDLGEDEEGRAGEMAAEANGAWKTNPLFDGPGLERPAPPETQNAAPPPPPVLAESAPLPEPPVQAQTESAVSPVPTQITPLPKSAASHTSLSAQAQKIAERLLAKVGAAVTRAGAMSDGGTQTTPSLELLALADRPHIHPPVLALPPVPNREPVSVEKQPQPPGSERGGDDGSPLPQDVNAAMAMAAQIADDIDFPTVEDSPPPADTVGSGEGEQGPRKLAFGSPVDAGQPEGGGAEDDDQPEVLDDPPEEPVPDPPITDVAPAPQAQSPAEDHALVPYEKRKPAEVRRPKSRIQKSRKSLAGAGLIFDKGVRRTTRVPLRPLEWWRNESYEWERAYDSLPTIARRNLLSPDPIWPRNDGTIAAKLRKGKAAAKFPALTCSSTHKL
ncbi:hypothetical protein KFL_000960050 [Klebsormidium nitens]|uniref:Uncharacterized protein n=1 Tax=Klebsormidium nitens TaxID=105231 RepID=A0A0U9HJI2_KLENI|nr:hypothetical protein KFL_000960050 [Klebsormidium nitens]|eukprot:GAQ81954.1 hypothetical protein KFL_000960050 [Klebsormidium nitens]